RYLAPRHHRTYWQQSTPAACQTVSDRQPDSRATIWRCRAISPAPAGPTPAPCQSGLHRPPGCLRQCLYPHDENSPVQTTDRIDRRPPTPVRPATAAHCSTYCDRYLLRQHFQRHNVTSLANRGRSLGTLVLVFGFEPVHSGLGPFHDGQAILAGDQLQRFRAVAIARAIADQSDFHSFYRLAVHQESKAGLFTTVEVVGVKQRLHFKSYPGDLQCALGGPASCDEGLYAA